MRWAGEQEIICEQSRGRQLDYGPVPQKSAHNWLITPSGVRTNDLQLKSHRHYDIMLSAHTHNNRTKSNIIITIKFLK